MCVGGVKPTGTSFTMKYLINLISKTSGKARFLKIEAENIKSAEAEAKGMFPTYEVGRICEDSHQRSWFSTVSRMRREDE